MKLFSLSLLSSLLFSFSLVAQISPPYKYELDSAHVYVSKRNYTSGLKSYQKSFKKGNTDPEDLYAAGRLATLLQRKDEGGTPGKMK